MEVRCAAVCYVLCVTTSVGVFICYVLTLCVMLFSSYGV